MTTRRYLVGEAPRASRLMGGDRAMRSLFALPRNVSHWCRAADLFVKTVGTKLSSTMSMNQRKSRL